MSHPSNLPEREATPEAAVLSRRRWLKWLGLGGLALGAGAGWGWGDRGSDAEVLASGQAGTGSGPYPARTNPRFRRVDRPLTDEAAAARYCNFYEFSTGKQVWRHVGAFRPLPWTLEVGGLAARPRTYDLDDLVR